MEGAGCTPATPATYWNAWGVLAMAFFPIAIAVGAMIYTGSSGRSLGSASPLTCRFHLLYSHGIGEHLPSPTTYAFDGFGRLANGSQPVPPALHCLSGRNRNLHVRSVA